MDFTTTEAMFQEAFAPNPPDQPRPEWVNGVCPTCGQKTVKGHYHQPETGFQFFTECWDSLGTHPTCHFRRQTL